MLNVVWTVMVWKIQKECNGRIFKYTEENMQILIENIKLETYQQLKLKYATFDFEYQFWE